MTLWHPMVKKNKTCFSGAFFVETTTGDDGRQMLDGYLPSALHRLHALAVCRALLCHQRAALSQSVAVLLRYHCRERFHFSVPWITKRPRSPLNHCTARNLLNPGTLGKPKCAANGTRANGRIVPLIKTKVPT
jgi:hypothetical protein